MAAPLAIIAQENNFDCSKTITQDQANQPAGTGYTILLADPLNNTNVRFLCFLIRPILLLLLTAIVTALVSFLHALYCPSPLLAFLSFPLVRLLSSFVLSLPLVPLLLLPSSQTNLLAPSIGLRNI